MVNAIATLLFSASYLPGALVLGKTLRQGEIFNEDLKLVVLLACELTPFEKDQVNDVFDEVIPIELIHARIDSHELKLLDRPELSPTFSKINLFKLTEFDKVLYLDSDTLPLKSITSIFDEFADLAETQIAASPDSGWPDIFNSGVFLIKPSVGTYLGLLDKIQHTSAPSFDGADQGLLNEYFHLDNRADYSWRRLPFLFNVTPSGQYQYQPAFSYFEEKVKLVHYIGSNKPWFETEDRGGLRHNWWAKYHEFFGSDDNIQKTVHGIDPIYYTPAEEYEEPEIEVEEHTDADTLLDPQSYQYFDTVQPDSHHWNAEVEAPPKLGKPEAESFPRSLSQTYDSSWNSEPYHDGSQDESRHQWKPAPIFPWEYEHREVVAQRVFNEPSETDIRSTWESLPLIKKIKDKQQSELKAQERARALAAQAEQDTIEFEQQKQVRLKEIERRYSGPISETIEEDLLDLENDDKELVGALENAHLEEKE